MMRYGSICSGIEAATVAVTPFGWDPVFYAEIEPFCCALLQHHYPTVPNVGDFTRIGKEVSVGTVDLVIGGTPCQSFSVAGQRGGLADPRGNLSLEYFALLDRLRPRWMVWENVPGLLSDDNGRTFGTCLGLLAELGYGFAYRVLDAQYFGVPQRRHRVFTVGYLGDWRPAAAVLFERHSLSGDPSPGRQTGQDLAACLTQGVDSQGKGGYAGRRREDDVNLVTGYRITGNMGGYEVGSTMPTYTNSKDPSQFLVAFDTTQITSKDNRCNPQPGDACHPLASTAHAPAVFSESGHGWWREGVGALRQRTDKDSASGLVAIALQEVNGRKSKNQNGVGIGISEPGTPMYTLQAGQQHGVALSFSERTRSDGRNGATLEETADALCNPARGGRTQSRQVLAPCLTHNYGKQPDNSDTGEGPMLIAENMIARRLTPRECEALQGLPQDYTLIPYRGKLARDGPRYRAIGNSFAVPVVRWIAHRISRVQEMLP